ncbi:hypothetical protein IEO21_10202 [Rhodonia placenta]|uniref:PH domain-containing protein n=2 Tax=Rhodonia placenta TaxID=104341 RepID=A0A1X6MR16_9APHY|nr:hypothetical protein POSPLADRAFT_1035925 [Postia placenta MAD-698-R-SB12]KAF9801119.1 hypothetical protein IEO21_10202 [Postia placenta]OSX58827.1 hypothetical protein POSPLADRAFT_1035925 [Postia placenta MAD-698-R-SB12]
MPPDFLVSSGKKLFEKHLHQYSPADPLYETYTDKRGRQRRRKSVKKRAHYLDKGFRLCGMRFGWTFVIGMVPGAGDIADATLNYVLVVRKAQEANYVLSIPDWLLHRMLANNAVSLVIGFVPLVGDVVLAVFKANSRNAELLEEFLRIRGEEVLRQLAEHQAAQQQQQQVASSANTGTITEKGARPGGKREGNGWFGWRKSKDMAAANPPQAPRPRASSDSRFVENMQS